MRHAFSSASLRPHFHAITIAVLVLTSGVAPAAPLTMDWSGTILQVFEDDGPTTFAGTQAGDPFSGSFGYDSNPGTQVPGCDSTLCEWSYGGAGNVGTISGLPGGVNGVFLLQENDQDLTDNPDDLDFLNLFLDPDIDVDTPFDVWELSSDLVNGDDLLFFGITWITTDTSAIADASIFDSSPPFAPGPIAGQGRAAIFAIEETTATGSFFAVGLIDSAAVTAIPVPAAAWLFGSALTLLGWVSRRSQLQR